jgi:O-antigen/teichoic acid export membrane protein
MPKSAVMTASSPALSVADVGKPEREGRALEGVIVIAIRLAGAGLGFVAQILAARLIGPEEFGRYSVILVWLLLMGHASTAGSNQVICRFLSHYAVAGDAARSAGLLRFSLVATALLSSLVAAIAIAVAIVAPFGLDPAYAALGALGFMAVPLLTLQEYLEAISRGIDRPSLGIGPAYIMRHLALAVGLTGLLVLGAEADALTVMALTMAGLACERSRPGLPAARAPEPPAERCSPGV